MRRVADIGICRAFTLEPQTRQRKDQQWGTSSRDRFQKLVLNLGSAAVRWHAVVACSVRCP